MALKKCKECGNQVSTTAKMCSNCGYNPFNEIKEKRKKSNSFGCLIVIGIICLIVWASNRSAENDKKARIELAEKYKIEHCKVDWSKLDKTQKQNLLQQFIESSDDLSEVLSPNTYKSIHRVAYLLLSSSIKYPSTIKVDGRKPNLLIYLPSRDAKITNVEKGLIEYSESFTSENKIGMEVKGTFWLTIKYNAGCKNYEVSDFEVQ